MPNQTNLLDQAPCEISFSQNLKSPYVVVVTIASPDKSLAQPSISVPYVYMNQCTVMYFRNGFRDWDVHVFQTADNTLKGCNVHFTICVECFEIHITYQTTFVNLLMAVRLKIVKFHFSNKKHQHIKNKNIYYENNFSIVIAFNFIFAHKTLMGTRLRTVY